MLLWVSHVHARAPASGAAFVAPSKAGPALSQLMAMSTVAYSHLYRITLSKRVCLRSWSARSRRLGKATFLKPSDV